MRQVLTSQQRIVICSGMGGIGKTELAVQYAKQQQQAYPGGICWLTVREKDLETEILEFAVQKLELELPPTLQASGVSAEQRVQWCWDHWKPKHGDVLVVLDDVISLHQHHRLLPTAPRFRLLITTRTQNLDTNAYEVPLTGLDREKSLELLKALVKDGDRIERERSTAEELCQRLGDLPLALELVGRYLRHDRALSLRELLGLLEAEGLEAEALAGEYPLMTGRRGVKAAFELSWQVLTDDSRMVARLLSVFALDEIPWGLAEWMMQRVNGETYAIREARKQLDNFSMVEAVEQKAECCKLHPLIREFLSQKQRMAVEETGDSTLLDAFVAQLVAIASQMPQSLTTQDILVFTPIRPHLQEVAQRYTEGLQSDDLLLAFVGLARFYAGQGLYAQAELWYEQCLRTTEARFEGDHPDVALSLNNLAVLYDSQGRLSEAEPLSVRSLEMSQRLFEGDHPAVASSLNNLAVLYDSQGRLSEAEPLSVRSLEMSQRLFAGDHPAVALSLNNLAVLYCYQERFPEAEPLLLQALEMRQRVLGSQHPDTQSTLKSLQNLHEQLQLPTRRPRHRSVLDRPWQGIRSLIQRIKRMFHPRSPR
jgi:tetratricopeptide (TPR) repeat protein